jgi:hypothetical protein
MLQRGAVLRRCRAARRIILQREFIALRQNYCVARLLPCIAWPEGPQEQDAMCRVAE